MSEEPEWKGNSLHHVSVQASPIILYKDLKKKIAEIRVKRDAIMLAHNTVNLDQDKYNKCIICLSLFSAFFESTKAQLDLAKRSDWIGPTSILMPILLSTILGIISSLMKFKKFPERMELLSKATEKSNATVLSMRRLSEALNFQPYKLSYEQYSGPVIESYRDALDYYERSLYPHEHDKYMKDAIKIAKDTRDREENHDNEIEKILNDDREERLTNNSFHFTNNVQLDTPKEERIDGGKEVIASSDTDSEDNTVIHNVKIDINDKKSLQKKPNAVKNNSNDVVDNIPPETATSGATEVSHDISSFVSKEVLEKREQNKKLKQQHEPEHEPEPEPEPQHEAEPEPESEPIVGDNNI